MSYCLYLRKSRADLEAEAHGDGETLLRHENILIELSKRLKLNITKSFREIVSGETIAARPVMQELLIEIESGLWEGVLVMEIERLARGDTIDQGIVAQTFKYSNTKIITPLKIYDPSNEFDEEYFEFSLYMSRREFKTINRRIQAGRISSIHEGKYISSIAPYGYERIKLGSEKGYILKIKEEEANVVRFIFDLYTKGELNPDGTYQKFGCLKIANKLNALQIKPRLNSTWSKSSINDILKNPVYIGKIRWQYRKEIRLIKNNKVQKSRPKAVEYITADGRHEPIIDLDTFNKASFLFSERSKLPVPGNYTLKNPLAGLIYCGKCGSKLTRLAKSKKTPYDSLKCPNHECDNISVPLLLVEEVLINELQNWFKNLDLHCNFNALTIPIEENIQRKQELIAKLAAQKSRYHLKLNKVYDFLEDGIYSIHEFKERENNITKQIETVEDIIQSTAKDLVKLEKEFQNKEFSYPESFHIIEFYKHLNNPQGQNEILKCLLEKVIFTKFIPNKKGNLYHCNFTLDIYPKLKKF